MTTVFHERPHCRFIEIKTNLQERYFIEQIKLHFFVPVLAIETMQESQYNFGEKEIGNILKDDFSSKTDPSIFTVVL